MRSSSLANPDDSASVSHSHNTGRALRFMTLLLLLVFAAASSALIYTAWQQNSQAAEQTRFYVDKVLESRQRQLETTLADYAFWSAAYEHLHLKVDLDWAYHRRNMGASLYESFGYEGVFVVGPDGMTRYGVINGELSPVSLSTWTGFELNAQIEAARQLAAEEEVVSTYALIDGTPALIALAALGNDSDPTVPLAPGPESVVVWVDRLGPDKLQGLGDEYGIQGLRIADSGTSGPDSLAIETLDGSQVGLQWESPRPGSSLLRLILPLLAVASLMLVLVIRLNLRNAVKAAAAIDAGHLAAQRYQAQLTFNAQHDPLTGLPNRSLLQHRLQQAQDELRDSGQKMAVMLLDLDGFKPINDSYGHRYGDCVLVEVARRLLDVAGPGNTVARLGGDEFVLLMQSPTGREAFELLAERVLSAIARPYQVEGHEFHITASAGLAMSCPELDQVQRLIQQADLAMYAAKADGRNIVQWFTSNLDHQAADRLGLRNDLHVALESDQLELYYQPQICAHSMAVTGVEALLRWQHPTRGIVSPAEFISLSEETGQIIPMSRWVLDAACRQLQQLSEAGHHQLTVAVNISSMHLMRRDFIEDVQGALQRNGVAPHRLELEVTESMLLRQVDQAAATLVALRELGVGIAIDDFGTGFSNLGYLRRLPVQRIKIDRSFVADLESSPQDAAIVEGILWLAHKLDLKVIAEGVETAAQAAFLARHRCEEFQGYFFAKPMPFGQLKDYLSDASARSATPLALVQEPGSESAKSSQAALILR